MDSYSDNHVHGNHFGRVHFHRTVPQLFDSCPQVLPQDMRQDFGFSHHISQPRRNKVAQCEFNDLLKDSVHCPAKDDWQIGSIRDGLRRIEYARTMVREEEGERKSNPELIFNQKAELESSTHQVAL